MARLLPHKKVNIANASLQWRDADNETAKDIRAAFKSKAVSIYFTEVYPGVEKHLRRLAREFGYNITVVAGNDAIALRRRGTRLLDYGHSRVNRPQRGKPPFGGHSERHAVWHTFRHKREVMTHAGAHWVTGWAKDEGRERKHDDMSEEIARLKNLKGKGRALFFWSGDINAPDGPGISRGYEVLHDNGLTTVWDELGVWPATHGNPKKGKTIDVIGSSDADKRVFVVSARAHRKVRSDHNRISAVFGIRRGKRKA